MTGLNVAIIGAGIGDLAAGLSLRARGKQVALLEEAESPRDAVAGISIPPNAVTPLKRTGLRDAIEKITTTSQRLTLRTSRRLGMRLVRNRLP
jgi:salicylate hydroxylase